MTAAAVAMDANSTIRARERTSGSCEASRGGETQIWAGTAHDRDIQQGCHVHLAFFHGGDVRSLIITDPAEYVVQ